jgi:hypothetical protein
VLAGDAEKGHDLLHLTVDPPSRERVHEIVRKHSRHTDSMHAHGDALVVSCAPGDAEGLRAKLEAVLRQSAVAVEIRHGTFAAGSDITQNVARLQQP